MFTWKHSETVDTQADAAQIWALWSDPRTWPQWDSSLESASLDGGVFIPGAKGRVKPKKGITSEFVLLEVKPLESFVNRSQLPLTTLDMGHFYTPATAESGSARITHTVVFDGWLAPLFGFFIGRKIRQHLRPAMLELARLAQAAAKSSATAATPAASPAP